MGLIKYLKFFTFGLPTCRATPYFVIQYVTKSATRSLSDLRRFWKGKNCTTVWNISPSERSSDF